MIVLRRLLGTAFLIALPCTLGSCSVLNLALNIGLAKLAFSCVPEGTEIDTPNGPVPIEQLNAGDQVIGFSGGTVTIQQKHQYREDETSNRFMSVALQNGARLALCDMHRIDGVRTMDFSVGDLVGGHLITSVESFSGVERSYDLLTDDAGYRISGIPVNSMIAEMTEAAFEQSVKK